MPLHEHCLQGIFAKVTCTKPSAIVPYLKKIGYEICHNSAKILLGPFP